MDTTVDHFTPLALRVRGNKLKLTCKQRVAVAISKLRSTFFTGYKGC